LDAINRLSFLGKAAVGTATLGSIAGPEVAKAGVTTQERGKGRGELDRENKCAGREGERFKRVACVRRYGGNAQSSAGPAEIQRAESGELSFRQRDFWTIHQRARLLPGRECCPNLNVAPPSWRPCAGWKPALQPKLGQHQKEGRIVKCQRAV